MEFTSRLKWAQALVQETHAQLEFITSLRTSGKIASHDLAPMIERAAEAHQWARAILTDVQAAELAGENRKLKAQVKRLRRRVRNATAA